MNKWTNKITCDFALNGPNPPDFLYPRPTRPVFLDRLVQNHMWFCWFTCSFKMHMFSFDPSYIYIYIYIYIVFVSNVNSILVMNVRTTKIAPRGNIHSEYHALFRVNMSRDTILVVFTFTIKNEFSFELCKSEHWCRMMMLPREPRPQENGSSWFSFWVDEYKCFYKGVWWCMAL